MIILQWQYIDELTWNDYDELTGVVNPRTSFIVRAIDDSEDSDLGDSIYNVVATKLVQICGDSYTAYVDFQVVDTETEKSYRPILVGIPESEIASIEWHVLEYVLDGSDLGDSDYDIIDFGESDFRDATGLVSVCVSAVVTFICDCDDLIVPQSCYTFNGETIICNELGLEMELEDGCYKPVRTGDIECCVALDVILWKNKETDVWSVLREPIETICANTVWFKRVVTFNNNVCPTVSIEINSDES